MEEEDDGKGRRWSVTYTKHLTQKRKVYRDGFLKLNKKAAKVLLYDDSDNLVETKFLTKDDSHSLRCGKSFAMDAHLVDIAEPVHLHSNPTVTLAPPLVHPNGATKRNSFSRKPLHKVPNLTQNGIKAKKDEPCTAAVPSSNSTLPQSLLEEWSVLFTTQLTQKAKKYHDGTLRLSQLGSHAKQVRLYDESERLLESKVLGKDEMLESGRTLIMQAHLVDIGLSVIQAGKENGRTNGLPPAIPQKGGWPSSSTSSVSSLRKPFQKPASTFHSIVETKKAAPVEASILGTDSILKEWNVLYTTQLNKKAKTYHDGILRLAQATGSLTKQITLASEEDQILGSRYLKSSECIESGAECELPGYLVQVYDLRVCKEGCAGNTQQGTKKQFVKSKILMKSIPRATNGTDDETKKEQAKSMNSKNGSSLEVEKSTKNTKCGSVALQDGRAGDIHRSPSEQFVKSKALVKSMPTTTDCLDDETKKEPAKSMNTQTGNRMDIEKSTDNNKYFSVARRDACQIISVLKKPTAVLETQVTQVEKKAKSFSQLIQIDDCPGEEELPSAE